MKNNEPLIFLGWSAWALMLCAAAAAVWTSKQGPTRAVAVPVVTNTRPEEPRPVVVDTNVPGDEVDVKRKPDEEVKKTNNDPIVPKEPTPKASVTADRASVKAPVTNVGFRVRLDRKAKKA